MRLERPLRYFFYAVVLAAILLPQQVISQTQSSSPSAQSTNTSTSGKVKQDPGNVNCTSNGTYVNSKGQTVKRPETCSGSPKGATAQCRDGSYSFSQSRRETCSHHGGVAKWF